MRTTHSKTVFLYRQVRRALQSGRYAPGQRIDPATLAAEFNTSATPVRYALYRLVGEGLLADQARAGLHVPLPTEIALRGLYGWMQRLLLIACDIGGAAPVHKPAKPKPASTDDDPVKLTWQLFDAIARATDDRHLHRTVKQANDQLAPIRRAKQGLVDNPVEELAELTRHWRERDLPALRSTLHDYHERRKRLVPQIVAALNERRDDLPH